MSNNDHDVHGSFADFLIRKFAAGEPAASVDDGAHDLDANDVAAFVRGGLLPGRRAAFQRQLLRDPLLREAVAFEEAHARRERRQRFLIRASVAAAAVLVIAVTLPSILGVGELTTADTVAAGRAALRSGNPTEAVALLEDAYAERATADTAELLTIARFASGSSDPLKGLRGKTDPRRADHLPYTQQELEALRVVRSTPNHAPAIGTRGEVLSRTPQLLVRHAGVSLRLDLYRVHDQKPLLRTTLRPRDRGEVEHVPLPEHITLQQGQRYGIEVRPEGTERVDVLHADFQVAPEHVRATCEKREALLTELIRDPALRNQAIGNMFMRRGLYSNAIETWRKIPEDLRSPRLSRAIQVADRLLWD